MMTIYSPQIRWLVIVCLALWVLIVMLYALLLALYAGPTLQRVLRAIRAALSQRLHCLWCWRQLHFLRWYPRRWPSHLCSQHMQRARAQLAARQARYVRYHLETQPAAPVLREGGGSMILTPHPHMAPARIPPVVVPVEACCYCWYVLHPTRAYPAEWSSTICTEHNIWIRAQHAAIRAARRASQEQQLQEVLV